MDGKATTLRQRRMVLYCLAFLACFSAAYLARDFVNSVMTGNLFGRDATLTCAGVDAYDNGLDPYYVQNLKNTQLSYSYLPFTFDLFRPFCHDFGFASNYKILFLALASLCVALLGFSSFSGRRMRDAALKALFILAGFAGFQWVFRTGNIAMFDGVFTALGLFFLLRGNALQPEDPGRSWFAYILGSLVLGFSTALKILYFPLLLGLYFIPVVRSRKLTLIAAAVFAFAVPMACSYFFYHDLFASWVACAFGHIPGQHSASTEWYNPSFYCMAKAILLLVGIGEEPSLAMLLYGMAMAIIVGAFLYRIMRIVGDNTVRGDTRPFLDRLDSLLLDHPQFAMRVVLLCMMALFLCSPRLKEYAFFELSLYAAMLVVDLPIAELLFVYVTAIAIPILSDQPQLKFLSYYFGGFDQLVVAGFCYVVLLNDLGSKLSVSDKSKRKRGLEVS